MHRCPRTVAQDGVLGGVNYDGNDRYCLDGQRLVAISGAYGADGTEYRTETESHSRIVSYGSQGSGPFWWKVWTKSGQIIEYGNTADSRIEAQGKTAVMLWALNRLADTVGNYLTVSYIEDNASGQYYPDRIDYTGNTAANKAPDNSVRFVYETRPDITPTYHAGSLSKLTVRLANVQSYAGDTLSRDYRVTYELSSATQRTRLASLTECTAADTCLAPTALAWSGSPEMSFGPIVESPFVAADTSTTSNAFDVGDFNGDGFADLVKTAGATHVAFGSATGELVGTMLGPSSSYPSLLVGDLNGDGISDVVRTGLPASLWWNVFVSSGSDALIDPGNYLDAYYAFYSKGTITNQLYFRGLFLRDINADGYADLVVFTAYPKTSKNYYSTATLSASLAIAPGRFRVGTPTKTPTLIVKSSAICTDASGCDQNQWFDIAELNGDGKADGIRYDSKTGNLHAWLSVGDGVIPP